MLLERIELDGHGPGVGPRYAATGCSSSALHSPAAASAFMRARWTNTACAASAFAASPPHACERRCLQRAPVGERERPRPADLVDRVQVLRRLDLGLAAGEEDDAGNRRGHVRQEAVDRELGDPLRRRLLRAALARDHHVRLEERPAEVDALDERARGTSTCSVRDVTS